MLTDYEAAGCANLMKIHEKRRNETVRERNTNLQTWSKIERVGKKQRETD